MIVVIQCAGRKRPNGGSLRTESGERVHFVGDPTKAPPRAGHVHARPDDPTGDGSSWREKLSAYQSGTNPHGLLKAYQLYAAPVYEELVRRFGEERTFILSAGWGLIRADYLTPSYDITFSRQARNKLPHVFRDPNDDYHDFCQVDQASDEPLFFFGGRDYLALFIALTSGVRGERVVYYNSKHPPDAPGCKTERYSTNTRTNWHYECAQRFMMQTH